MIKTILYFILTLATVFFAVPRIPLMSSSLEAKIFSVVWLLFALVILGAHLDYLLLLDDKKRKQLAKRKKYQLWKKEQYILNTARAKMQRVKGTH